MNDIRFETVPVPRITAHDILVQVAACGVCPTDIKKVQYGKVPPPRVFGHETAGTIVRVGARTRSLSVGDRVALHHHVPCLKSHACRHRAFAQCPQCKRIGIAAGFEPAGGGYAEYVPVMSFCLPGVVKILKRNTLEEGAMLEPVNTVLKAVRRLNILRAYGIGQWPRTDRPDVHETASLQGIKVVATDLMPARLKLAKKYGATTAAKPDQPSLPKHVDRLTNSRGLDAAIVAVPVDAAVQQATDLRRGAGQLLLIAHTKRDAKSAVDLSTICVDEKDLIGSHSADITLQPKVAKVVFSRKFDVRSLISHRLSLKQTQSAVDLAANPSSRSLKVMVTQPA